MTGVVGIIGHPVAHSISPRFQQAAFDALGIDARYEAWDVLPDGLAAQMHRLRRPEALGANVTIPYKEAAARHTDGLDQTARFVGAINTVVNHDGLLEGYNTDVTGFQRSLQEAGFDPVGADVVIWGAGGAARAVAWALIWRKAARLTIVNRTLTRAGRLQQDISNAAADVHLRSHGADELAAGDALARCDLVVQCTSVGLHGSETENDLPFTLEALRADAMIVDLIANPAESALVRAAKTSGRAALGGLPMLVYQGAAALELWTRRDPPVDVMFRAAEAAMAEAPQ